MLSNLNEIYGIKICNPINISINCSLCISAVHKFQIPFNRLDAEESGKALTELDTQHQGEIQQLLQIRDSLNTEVKSLQEKLEEELVS